MKIDSLTTKDDLFFMQHALDQAEIAYKEDEVPIGAIIVSESKEIIGWGYNKTEQQASQIYHAEVNAIQQASKVQKNWRLDGATLYVTVEPCVMCFGLIGLSRINRVVFGAASPLFGYHLDIGNLSLLYQKHIKNITQGVMEKKAQDIVKKFFKQKRRTK